MSPRVDIQVNAMASPAPTPKTLTGTLFITGVVATGPVEVQKISSISAFRTLYGTRVEANAALHDAIQTFFAEGGTTCYVVAGATPYQDDWSTYLDKFTNDLGPGAVAIAGVGSTIAAEYVGAHCETNGRLGLICGPESQTAASAASAAATATGEGGSEFMIYLWPWVTIPGLDDPIEPLGFAAGVRARAHGSSAGAAQSPMAAEYGSSRFVNGIETAVTDSEFTSLNTARVSTIRIMQGKLRMYGWTCLANPEGDTVGNLAGGQFRDLINVIVWKATQVAEDYVGRIVDGRGITLGEFGGDLTGVVAPFAASGALFARLDDDGKELDPGYVVNSGSSINPPEDLATGELKAEIGVRLSPSAEFIVITIAATDAAGTI